MFRVADVVDERGKKNDLEIAMMKEIASFLNIKNFYIAADTCWLQWLMPVTPVPWKEAEAGGWFEPRISTPACATWSLHKKTPRKLAQRGGGSL